MSAQKRSWLGELPMRCDICNRPMEECRDPVNPSSEGKTFIDGRTVMGPWANMGEGCFAIVGTGIGLGKGQRYDLATGQKLEG